MRKTVSAFIFGALAYPVIELIWRRRTHHTMCAVGGMCCVAVCALSRRLRSKNKLLRRAAITAAVTVIELYCGVLINGVLGLSVWDYSKRRGNILGQICPFYSALWFLLVSAADSVLERLDNKRAAQPQIGAPPVQP